MTDSPKEKLDRLIELSEQIGKEEFLLTSDFSRVYEASEVEALVKHKEEKEREVESLKDELGELLSPDACGERFIINRILNLIFAEEMPMNRQSFKILEIIKAVGATRK
jgi:hypothetical protein